ncbi:MAG: hypothetical protein GTN62_02450 [Gemmatimonadales bacterium]|nr:hypothetical protein [Gemmatimonadales bacterium]NIN10205.1 hypothetical protein [Gemmatimonadales bacterium]NIN48961.1 hypothetical protein [Gemmatimonadales bacterium]NIP06425.1 hypothetical protein [Gemmatimonadales bacterium]NIS63650.1 hypothetical protein [Gemmatimonadales bacterium]
MQSTPTAAVAIPVAAPLAGVTATARTSDTEGASLLFQYRFQNPDLSEEERVTEVIGRMALEEKIGALGWRPGVPRLGVIGSFHIEGYHGVAQGGPSNWGRERSGTAETESNHPRRA